MTRSMMMITGIIVLASCNNDSTGTQTGDSIDRSKTNASGEDNYVMENNVANKKKNDTALYDARALDSIQAVDGMAPTDTAWAVADTTN